MIISDLSEWNTGEVVNLTLPLPENRANARWHWRTEKKKKDAYYLSCLARYGKLPRATFERAVISVDLYMWNLMDRVDNLPARLKWPLDWLVLRRYIVDDSAKVLEPGSIRQFVDRKNQRLEVTLTEIEG